MVKKVTFTLDEHTVRKIELTASRLGKAKSQIIRDAVADYHERSGRLSEAERLERLATFDRVIGKIPRRPQEEVEREIEEIRAARRGGGRRHPA